MSHRSDFLSVFALNPPNLQKNPIARWSFQQNCYSSSCTAKSPFAVNCVFNNGSNRLFGLCIINYVQW